MDAARTTAIVMLLEAVSTVLSFVMSLGHIPEAVSSALLGLSDNPSVILIIMMVILLAVGTFMDPTFLVVFRRSRCGCPPSWASPDLVGTLGFGRVGSRS